MNGSERWTLLHQWASVNCILYLIVSDGLKALPCAVSTWNERERGNIETSFWLSGTGSLVSRWPHTALTVTCLLRKYLSLLRVQPLPLVNRSILSSVALCSLFGEHRSHASYVQLYHVWCGVCACVSFSTASTRSNGCCHWREKKQSQLTSLILSSMTIVTDELLKRQFSM